MARKDINHESMPYWESDSVQARQKADEEQVGG